MTSWHVNSGREGGGDTHLDPTQVAGILSLHARGIRNNDIARRMGISSTTVSRRIRQARKQKEHQDGEADAA